MIIDCLDNKNIWLHKQPNETVFRITDHKERCIYHSVNFDCAKFLRQLKKTAKYGYAENMKLSGNILQIIFNDSDVIRIDTNEVNKLMRTLETFK